MKTGKLLLIVTAYILAAPFLAIWGLVWAVRYGRTLMRSVTTSVVCSNCRQEIALVGLWQCGCGFAYQGHLLRPCPVCGRVPRIVRCINCSVTTQLT
jgi:hypothetical protein